VSRPRAAPQAGFTLVEALVSLFVFSLISAGAVMALMLSVRGQESLAAADRALRDVQITQAVLAGDAAQMALRPVREAGGGILPGFVGGPAPIGIGFVRANADSAPITPGVALSYVAYSLEGDALVRTGRAALDPALGAPQTRRVLLTGLSNARFTFFDGLRWLEAWPANSGPGPRAIALEAQSAAFGPIRIAVLAGAL
jgi:general secretion pathway protein J